MLEGAEWRLERGEYDLACFEAEQAAQLALKALLYELSGSTPRIHDLGELLGVLYDFLRKAGLEDAAGRVADFASRERRRLWLLSDAYYRGRYGAAPYTREDALDCIEAARGVLRLAGELRRAVHRGDSGEAAA